MKKKDITIGSIYTDNKDKVKVLRVHTYKEMEVVTYQDCHSHDVILEKLESFLKDFHLHV